MRKGVVIKLNKDKATIMAEDCTFLDIKSFKGMYEGMEVCFGDSDIIKRKVVFKRNRYVNAACFMLLVFCSYLFLSFYQENIAAYAYVGIQINPSVEIALNKKGKIIKTRGLDEEGQELLEEIDIRKMDGVEGVKQIIAKTIDMNYMEPEDVNQITVYTVLEKEDNSDGGELLQKVQQAIEEEVVAHSLKGEIKTIVSDKKIKKQADKLGISVADFVEDNAKTASAKAEDKKDKELKENQKEKDKQDKEDRKDKLGKDSKNEKWDKDDDQGKDKDRGSRDDKSITKENKENKKDDIKDWKNNKDIKKEDRKKDKKADNKEKQGNNPNKNVNWMNRGNKGKN